MTGTSRSARNLWRRWLQPLAVAVLVVTPFRSAVADWNDVPTGSMKPTILEGDRILVDKLAYDLKLPFTTWHLAEWGAPARGDVVVCLSPHDGRRLVKRVIGLPGDVVALVDGRLHIDGRPIAYGPAAAQAAASLTPSERAGHLLASEGLGRSGRHAIMLARGRRSGRRFGPVTVPPRSYLVLGDNRDDSFDSRGFGFVPRDAILGRATRIAFSRDPAHLLWLRRERTLAPLD